MPDEIRRVLGEADRLHTPAEIGLAVDRMAENIRARLEDHNPVLLGCMVGGHVPLAMLLERLHFPLEVDYVHATRYRGATAGGALHWLRDPPALVAGRVVLVVDDLIDHGHTLAAIVEACGAAGAAEVQTAVLVQKDVRERDPDLRVDYAALTTPDRYLFGYGMDYKGYLRNAPGIYAVRGR